MLARTNTDPVTFLDILSNPGTVSTLSSRVSLSEFAYKKGIEIYGESEPADYVYQIKTGAVRSYKLLCDGRRQIGAFHLVGDIFGLENGSKHRFTTEAIVDTTVCLVKRRSRWLLPRNPMIPSSCRRDRARETVSIVRPR